MVRLLLFNVKQMLTNGVPMVNRWSTNGCMHLAEDRSDGLGPSPGPGLGRVLAELEKWRGWSGENEPIFHD